MLTALASLVFLLTWLFGSIVFGLLASFQALTTALAARRSWGREKKNIKKTTEANESKYTHRDQPWVLDQVQTKQLPRASLKLTSWCRSDLTRVAACWLLELKYRSSRAAVLWKENSISNTLLLQCHTYVKSCKQRSWKKLNQQGRSQPSS